MVWSDIDRKVEYKGSVYKVLDSLGNNLLLVVLLSDYIEGNYPLTPLLIPGD